VRAFFACVSCSYFQKIGTDSLHSDFLPMLVRARPCLDVYLFFRFPVFRFLILVFSLSCAVSHSDQNKITGVFEPHFSACFERWIQQRSVRLAPMGLALSRRYHALLDAGALLAANLERAAATI
jgi:hypothetical protein